MEKIRKFLTILLGEAGLLHMAPEVRLQNT